MCHCRQRSRKVCGEQGEDRQVTGGVGHTGSHEGLKGPSHGEMGKGAHDLEVRCEDS